MQDVNHLLVMKGKEFGLHLSLSDYKEEKLSPLNSRDICQAAENFTENIFYPFFSEQFEKIVQTEKEQLIGFSLNYLSQVICCFAMIGFLQRNFPDVKIVVGGGLATTWMHHANWAVAGEPLRKMAHFVSGRGEKPLLEMLEKKERLRHHQPDYSELSGPYLSPGTILPYTTSWGCFWKKCKFCPETSENNPYSHTPPEITASHLQSLCKKEQPMLIHFLDNAVSPSTLKMLAQNPPPVPWYGFARFDRLLTDQKFCLDLRTSGCVMLKLGLESGDQSVLDGMAKGIELERVSKILANLKNAGIATYVYLLFGTPCEDEIAAFKTMEYVARHNEEINFLNLAIFNLPRLSSEITETALQTVDYNADDLSLYQDFQHPKKWNRGKIRRFLQNEFRKHPDISPILHRDPPFFTSNHAPFFTFL